MSTRATYKFRRQYHRDVTVYIHHDGYPEGAAGLYLVPAIEMAAGYLTPEWFIRANERAEITDGHEAHGDTEYRYTIDLQRDLVEVQHRNLAVVGEPEWKLLRQSSLATFLTQYGQDFRPGVEVKQASANRWMTAEMARADAEGKAAAAAAYREKFPMYAGNARANDVEAEQARAFADSFGAQQVAA